MNWTKAIALSVAIVGLGQAHAAPSAAPTAQAAPSALTTSLQSALTRAEKLSTTQALTFDDASSAALSAMQTVIIESGEQPLTVQAALTVVAASTRPGAVALDILRGRVQQVAIDCGLQQNQALVRARRVVVDTKANQDANKETASVEPLNSCAAGLSVASTGSAGGLGVFGPPSFTAGGSDYTPAP